MSERGFASVILDVDSTLSAIEGIDWLASRCGVVVTQRVKELTALAMSGDIALDGVYGERLALVRPDWRAVSELADAYTAALATNAQHVIRRLLAAGKHIVLVSGGIREAIVPMAVQLGIHGRDVHAVSLQFDSEGFYAGYDKTSALTTSSGKRTVVEALDLPRRAIAVGDGVTDLAIRPVVDSFGVYTEFTRRESVAELADVVIETFDQLAELVLA